MLEKLVVMTILKVVSGNRPQPGRARSVTNGIRADPKL